MKRRILPWIAAAALFGAAGCGSDDEDNEQAATATTPAAGQATTTAEDRAQTTTVGDDSADGDELSPEGRAVLVATEDLAADVSETAQEFADGTTEEEEAIARLELARDRAADIRARAEKLPVAERGRTRLASLNEEIGRTATDVSKLVSSGRGASGRAASRDDIETRIDELRDEARATFDDVRELLDRPAQERFRDALDRIGVKAPG